MPDTREARPEATTSTPSGPARTVTTAIPDLPRRPEPHGPARADNAEYVAWLEASSMLAQATARARQVSGQGSLWRNPYALPDPRRAVEQAPVWFTAYPAALLTAPGTSFLQTVGDPALWDALARIGVRAMHTGPVKIAGGLTGWERTPTVDGHFDRISTAIDPTLGSADDYRMLTASAAAVGGTVIDDIIPGHTGKGADFRLAEMRYADYPGIYHMVEIAPEHWDLLPDVHEENDSANLGATAERELADLGYIVGEMQRVIFAAPGVKETNWSATRPVVGVDGVERRWVYLHYFKEGQPQVNWLDPSFAGPRMIVGDALHSLTYLGTGGLRLDANGFLGIERSADGGPAWSEGHPLAGAGNHLIAGMVRKLGGFTFQELNLSMDAIYETGQRGPDLSYDFVTRPGYQHALATGDTEFLRLTIAEARRIGVDPAALVHALQNHDELTYELVHFEDVHRDDEYAFRGATMSGAELARTVRSDLLAHLTGEDAPYNLPFTTNGIACTTASVAAASLGVRELDAMTDDEIDLVRRAHLLLAAYNAWQPGVFALSGWDVRGVLTVPAHDVEHLMGDADTRWINRGAHDLMGVAPDAQVSTAGLPRARALYGSIPEQLADPASFLSHLATILRVRDALGIATGQLVDLATSGASSVLGLVHLLPSGALELTALNFGQTAVTASFASPQLEPGSRLIDAATG
ncbi:MAG TPA: maltose alpha-D-glucosyltransferase, partial [Candidatus Nanopelagicales bacterium]|nr:maltose alpha-D-glucosyltransferase [Candidatus Nanopelagicales bacterium]